MNENYRELSDEELEQVNGGFTIGGARITKASPKKSGSAITTEDRYTALAGLTLSQLQEMEDGDPLYELANEYLMLIDGKVTQHLDNYNSFSL